MGSLEVCEVLVFAVVGEKTEVGATIGLCTYDFALDSNLIKKGQVGGGKVVVGVNSK